MSNHGKVTQERVTREMTFAEDLEILEEESERLFAQETEGSEPPFANCVVRRALRCIKKLHKELYKYENTGMTPDEIEHMKEDRHWVPKSAGKGVEKDIEVDKFVVYYADGSRRIIDKGFFCEMKKDDEDDELVLSFIMAHVAGKELQFIILGCIELAQRMGLLGKREENL